MIEREPIYAGAFDLLKAATKVRNASRRLQHWADVSPPDMPALFFPQGRQEAIRSPGMDAIWRLHADVHLYVHTNGNAQHAPGQLLNPLMDAIELLLRPDNPITNKCTLGGLVQHAWIEGTIETDEGTLGDIGVAIIPIIMLAPSA